MRTIIVKHGPEHESRSIIKNPYEDFHMSYPLVLEDMGS